MVVKTVFCKIGSGEQSRCKKVKYEKASNVSDCESIKVALLKCSEKDVLLGAMLNKKDLILQKEEPKINQFCDIDSQDDVDDNSIINVVLMSKQEEQPVAGVVDYKVIATFNDPVVNSNFNPYFNLDDELLQTEQSVDENLASNIPTTSRGRNFQRPRVGYPAELPPLPPKLRKLKDDETVYEHQLEFINLWSSHLESLTDNSPTKTEYRNYCKTIVDTYPELKGGDKNDCDVVKSQISASIRNRRYNRKLQLKKCASSKNMSISGLGEKTKPMEQKNPDDAIAALKACSAKDESNHVKRLLQETFKIRRMWIESDEAKSVRDIINKYPQLEIYSLIILEFSIMREKTVEQFFELVDKMIEKCATYFDVDCQDEEQKMNILTMLHENLTLAKFRKIGEPLITVEEAGKSTNALLTANGSSPRLVVYTAEKRIAEAFVVCSDGRVKIPEPNAQKSLLCLFAAYYVWHCQFPTAYLNTLQYLDYEILGLTNAKSNKISKFLRDLQHKLKLKSNAQAIV